MGFAINYLCFATPGAGVLNLSRRAKLGSAPRIYTAVSSVAIPSIRLVLSSSVCSHFPHVNIFFRSSSRNQRVTKYLLNASLSRRSGPRLMKLNVAVLLLHDLIHAANASLNVHPVAQTPCNPIWTVLEELQFVLLCNILDSTPGSSPTCVDSSDKWESVSEKQCHGRGCTLYAPEHV